MASWLIEGVVLASALPFDGFGGLAQCSVGPIPSGELNAYYLPQLHAIPPPADQKTYEIPFAAMANQIGFYALHRITSTVTASSLDAALAEAETRFRRTSVALAFTGSPIKAPSCSVRIVRWQHLDEKTGAVIESGAPRPLVAEGRRTVEVVAFEKMANAIDLAALAAGDEVLGRLFDTWYRAEQLYLVAARQDERRWAVLEYARLIEDIAKQVAPATTVENYAALMMGLKASLSAALSAAQTAEEVRLAVKGASNEMATIRGEVTKLQIAESGSTLDVGTEAAEAAQRTWDVRSRRAAHKAGAIKEDEVYWAHASAGVYLEGYIQQRQQAKS
jgi:hypothetical protein